MQKPTPELKPDLLKLNRVLNTIHSYLDQQLFYPREKSYLDAAVLTLMSKSVTLARSTACLVKNGFDEEAFASSRTLLELALNLRYIVNGRNPEVRAKRYIHYVAKIKMEWARRSVKHFVYSASMVRKGMPNYKKFQALERKFPRHGWVQSSKKRSKGIWTMAIEPDRYEKVPLLDKKGKPVLDKHGKPKLQPYTWVFDYEILYFWTSQFVHVTIDSVDNHNALPGKLFSVYTQGCRPSVRKNNNLGSMAIFNTILYMHKILASGFNGLGHKCPDKLSNPVDALLKSLVPTKPGKEDE